MTGGSSKTSLVLAGLIWALAWGLGLAAGCRSVSPGPVVSAPPAVMDQFYFLIQNESLQPISGARLDVMVEAGQAQSPLPLTTDSQGRARLTLQADVSRLVADAKSEDTLLSYRSVISYRISAEGYLPAWGRAELNDALEAFSRPKFSSLMDRRPRDKTRSLRHVLVRIEDIFEPGALSDPLARTVAASLPVVWRTWTLSGHLERVRPVKSSWAVKRRSQGPYLKVGLELLEPLNDKSDPAVRRAFVQDFIPVMDDLAALYAPFLSGWDMNFRLGFQPKKDPHAMPEILPLRLVFSEDKRTQLMGRPGGLNWLICQAESCTLKGKPWNLPALLAKEEKKSRLVWDWLALFFAPGPGQIPEASSLKDTSE
ncbi:MAG: hypothetical protein JRJ59_06575 [Deltaproteobacteria bacterium]|nr:hypothetical protein [Deltaproteobacteria bacterium]